jgi:translation initiation factor 5A
LGQVLASSRHPANIFWPISSLTHSLFVAIRGTKNGNPGYFPSHTMSSDEEVHQEVFETTVSAASETFPMQCSALRKNGHVVLKGRPCKIVDMSTSKTGKHGHAKVNLVGIDIFTGRKYEDMSPSTHNMDVPNVLRNEYVVLNVEDGFMSLMTTTGETKDDVKVPEGELGEQIQSMFDDGKEIVVTVIKALGEEAAISVKEAPK